MFEFFVFGHFRQSWVKYTKKLHFCFRGNSPKVSIFSISPKSSLGYPVPHYFWEFRFRGNNTHCRENMQPYTSCENTKFRETCKKINNPVVTCAQFNPVATCACREPGGCTDEPYYDGLTLFWPCAQFNLWRMLSLTLLWRVQAESLVDVLMNPITTV
jgi:hypothetical protein